jgi:hypothetical protein
MTHAAILTACSFAPSAATTWCLRNLATEFQEASFTSDLAVREVFEPAVTIVV